MLWLVEFHMDEGALAEVDSVFKVGLETAGHVHPANAIPIRALPPRVRLRPAGFGNEDRGDVVAEWLETEFHRVHLTAVAPRPLEEDETMGDDLPDLDWESFG